MTKKVDDNAVVITKVLAGRHEFWVAVIAVIVAVVIIVLAVLWLYPELLSEIVHLYEDDPAPVYVSPRLMEPYEYEPCLPTCATWTPVVTP